jgi:hypothetical protein
VENWEQENVKNEIPSPEEKHGIILGGEKKPSNSKMMFTLQKITVRIVSGERV